MTGTSSLGRAPLVEGRADDPWARSGLCTGVLLYDVLDASKLPMISNPNIRMDSLFIRFRGPDCAAARALIARCRSTSSFSETILGATPPPALLPFPHGTKRAGWDPLLPRDQNVSQVAAARASTTDLPTRARLVACAPSKSTGTSLSQRAGLALPLMRAQKAAEPLGGRVEGWKRVPSVPASVLVGDGIRRDFIYLETRQRQPLGC